MPFQSITASVGRNGEAGRIVSIMSASRSQKPTCMTARRPLGSYPASLHRPRRLPGKHHYDNLRGSNIKCQQKIRNCQGTQQEKKRGRFGRRKPRRQSFRTSRHRTPAKTSSEPTTERQPHPTMAVRFSTSVFGCRFAGSDISAPTIHMLNRPSRRKRTPRTARAWPPPVIGGFCPARAGGDWSADLPGIMCSQMSLSVIPVSFPIRRAAAVQRPCRPRPRGRRRLARPERPGSCSPGWPTVPRV